MSVDPTATFWSIAEGDKDVKKQLIDYNIDSLPGCFKVKESNKFLVLFHNECSMPHMDNLKVVYDPLPNFYMGENRPGVDGSTTW